MASLSERVVAVAKALIVTAGMTNAVAATDIASAAQALHKQYAEYTKSQIANKIADEIKRTHTPGISGSV